MGFMLDAQLAADSLPVCVLNISEIRLINDARFPWLIAVPQRAGISELHELSRDDYIIVLDEVAFISRTLMQLCKADKMNVAALGNMVHQLHIHIIARHNDDVAWPKPIWGIGAAVPYPQEQAETFISDLQETLLPVSNVND